MSTEAPGSQNRRGGRHHREGSSRNREERDSKKDERRVECHRQASGDGYNESSKDRLASQLLTTPQERKRKISIGKRGSAVLKSFLPDLLQKSPPSSPVLASGHPPSATCLSTPASQRSSPPLHHSPTPPSLSTTASSPTTPPSLSTPPSLESLRSGLRSDWEGSALSRLALANSLLERQEEPKLRGLAHSTSDTTCDLKSAR